MKILNSVFENYARILTSQVNGIFRVMTDITVMEVQEKRYYEYVNSFQENDCMTLVDRLCRKRKAECSYDAAYHAGPCDHADQSYAGRRREVIRVEEDYRYSDVELASTGGSQNM